MPTTVIALQGCVKGRVQGVFFRVSTQQQALKLGIGGWVRNTPDGHVEVCLTGPEERVADMVQWLYSGPARAQVVQVDLSPIDCEPLPDFQIRR